MRARRAGRAGRADADEKKHISSVTSVFPTCPTRPTCATCLTRLTCPMSLPAPAVFTNNSPTRHGFHGENLVEPFGVDETARQHELPDRFAALHRLFRDVRRHGVAEVRAERRRGCRAPIQQLTRAPLVGSNAVDR